MIMRYKYNNNLNNYYYKNINGFDKFETEKMCITT